MPQGMRRDPQQLHGSWIREFRSAARACPRALIVGVEHKKCKFMACQQTQTRKQTLQLQDGMFCLGMALQSRIFICSLSWVQFSLPIFHSLSLSRALPLALLVRCQIFKCGAVFSMSALWLWISNSQEKKTQQNGICLPDKRKKKIKQTKLHWFSLQFPLIWLHLLVTMQGVVESPSLEVFKNSEDGV